MLALLTATALGALVNPTPQQRTESVLGRRAVLASAGAALFAVQPRSVSAKVSELGQAGLSKEDFNKALAARKEAERVAALPINQLKQSREEFATASTLVETGDWNKLRDLISDTTGRGLVAITKEGGFSVRPGVRDTTTKLRKVVFDVDNFAYSQQEVPGANLFSGYCAEGVVPRDDSGCKLKPTGDKKPLLAKLKEANALFDQLIKQCEA